MLTAADQLPVVLKISAVAVGPLASEPPLISRRPSLKTTVHAPLRAADMLPAATQDPVETEGNDARKKKLIPNNAVSRSVYRSARSFMSNLEGDKYGSAGETRPLKPNAAFASRLL